MKKYLATLLLTVLPCLPYTPPTPPVTPPTPYTICDINVDGRIDADDYFIFDLTYTRTGAYPSCTPITPVTPPTTTPVISSGGSGSFSSSGSGGCVQYYPAFWGGGLTSCWKELWGTPTVVSIPKPIIKPVVKPIYKTVHFEGKG